MIDASARIEATATIGHNVTVGPYCTVGPLVTLGEGCRLLAHVNLTGRTTIGPRTVIHPFASLGSPPQSVHYRGGATRLTVGADCDIREYVTMNIGTEDGGGLTKVGDRCFFMAGSHVAHDCSVGSDVTFANNTLLGGHVAVGDHVTFGGGSVVRQFSRVGDGAMIAGVSGVHADVIPWGMVQGSLAKVVGLNVVGMRRHGFSKTDIQRYRQAFQALFFGDGEFRARVERAAADYAGDALVMKLVAFIRAGKRPLSRVSKRGEVGEDA